MFSLVKWLANIYDNSDNIFNIRINTVMVVNNTKI